jgi:endoglucanase
VLRQGRLILAALVLAAVASMPAAARAANLRVSGSRLVDGPGSGHVVQLRGVNRSGLEYACIQGWGFFDSPHPDQIDRPAMIAAMKSWDINVVRVPLNEDCWLGVNTPPGRGGSPYRRIVERYVHALVAAHLYVIIDLHVAAPGSVKSLNIFRMPDADHAPAFWRSVARTFRGNHALLFDLYNEPHYIDWNCWRNGCEIPANNDYGPEPAYRAAGMQQIVDAVRSTGARQPLMLGGVSWSLDLSGWIAHEPHDSLHQLVASEHNYGVLAPCGAPCRTAILATHRHVPIVMGELGETDCAQGYIDAMMPWADRHGISYLGWAWDAHGGWTCRGGPTLITSYDGTPTPFGVGLRDHFRALGVPFRP